MSAVKLCRDCKHFIAAGNWRGACGKAPMPPDYVDGGDRGYIVAQLARESSFHCGKDAAWFEPKEGA